MRPFPAEDVESISSSGACQHKPENRLLSSGTRALPCRFCLHLSLNSANQFWTMTMLRGAWSSTG